jgi:hypothetical protein
LTIHLLSVVIRGCLLISRVCTFTFCASSCKRVDVSFRGSWCRRYYAIGFFSYFSLVQVYVCPLIQTTLRTPPPPPPPHSSDQNVREDMVMTTIVATTDGKRLFGFELSSVTATVFLGKQDELLDGFLASLY